MKLHLALVLSLGLSFAAPAMAEPLSNPGEDWWASFLTAVDGAAPDFERLAKADPEYLAADEFTRAEVLARVVERLRAERAQIDVAGTEVKVSIGARLGDYSAENGGFPVDIFAEDMRLQPANRELFFRNWDEFSLFTATVDEGKALRQRIGKGQIRAEVTLGDIRPSVTRTRAYDARILHVGYFAEDGLLLAEIEAPEAQVIAEADGAAMVEAMRGKLLDLASIPPLGTPWVEAKDRLIGQYPFMASDQFAYPDTGKTAAYLYERGRTVADYPHEADQPFRVFLQQADGEWRVRPGFSIDINLQLTEGDAVDTKGTGPGLACYTPEVNDRCAVLEFSPAAGGHILTRAYGVIELDRTGTAKEVFDSFVAGNGTIFEGFSAPLDYDPGAVRSGVRPQFLSGGGVDAYAAGAGAVREGEPVYDPLKNTSGTKAINREIALFTVDGAETRVPLIFVLQ